MIVLDTNVLSEIMRPSPSSHVMRWLALQPAQSIYTTTITQAEILYGVELLPKGKRRIALHEAVTAMFDQDFDGRILPFDGDAARAFSRIASARRAAGRPITQFDAQIAAIATARKAAIATRNTLDFEGCGPQLVDPWAST